MGGSPIINVLVYKHNGVSTLMHSIGFKTPIDDSHNKLFKVYILVVHQKSCIHQRVVRQPSMYGFTHSLKIYLKSRSSFSHWLVVGEFKN